MNLVPDSQRCCPDPNQVVAAEDVLVQFPQVPTPPGSGGGGAGFDPITVPRGADVPVGATFTFPDPTVRTFTVANEGTGDVVVTLPSGGTVTLNTGGSRTWGTADAATLLDVSGVSIFADVDSDVDVSWEEA